MTPNISKHRKELYGDFIKDCSANKIFLLKCETKKVDDMVDSRPTNVEFSSNK